MYRLSTGWSSIQLTQTWYQQNSKNREIDMKTKQNKIKISYEKYDSHYITELVTRCYCIICKSLKYIRKNDE